ncbi:MAG: hypothetical protein QM501_14055 [Gimesia sp.]
MQPIMELRETQQRSKRHFFNLVQAEFWTSLLHHFVLPPITGDISGRPLSLDMGNQHMVAQIVQMGSAIRRVAIKVRVPMGIVELVPGIARVMVLEIVQVETVA